MLKLRAVLFVLLVALKTKMSRARFASQSGNQRPTSGLFNGDASGVKEGGRCGEWRLRGQLAIKLLLVHSGSKERDGGWGGWGGYAHSDFTVHSVKADWSRCYSGMASYSGE